MSPSRKTTKNQHPLPPPVDFETWKAKLALLLKHRSPELDALGLWIQHHSAYFAQIGHSELTSTDALLEGVFKLTQPELASEHERYKHEYAATKIRELLPEIESAIGALKATGSSIVPRDGIPGRLFHPLQRSLEDAANQIRWALIIFDRPYMRSADIISHCISFLASIYLCEVRELDSLALTSLLMKAHGFSDEQLEVFDKRSVESGKIRKRIKAYCKANSNISKVQKDFLESRSKRPSDRSNTCNVQALSEKLMSLLKDSNPRSV
jgi:hypothetical protein